MTAGAKIAIVLSIAGIAAMVAAFLVSASPYVTIREAKAMKPGSDGLHVAGDLIPKSLSIDAARGNVEFQLKDTNGDIAKVRYSGTPPANMGSATKIVAIGSMQPDGSLLARKLLLKCPSKYESEPGVKPVGA